MIFEKLFLDESNPNVTLTTYVLSDSEEILKGKNRPAVLVCPGGAYAFCSDREAEPIALQFNAMGYHAFVLNYSVFSHSGGYFATPESEVYKPSVQPGPMIEIGKAMLAIRENADKWHVDMDKVILTGYSAGGHNVAMFSTYWDKPVICEALGCKPADIRPAAAVIGYGFFDVRAFQEELDRIGDQNRIGMNYAINFNFSGKFHPDDEEYEFNSPAHQVSENTPPMFLWSTFEDSTVPVSQTTIMATALATHDIPFEMHIFEKGDHGLSTANHTSAAAMDQTNADVAQWIGLADRWLRKRFIPEIPEVTPPWNGNV